MSAGHRTIERIRARPVVAPLKRPVRTALGTIPDAPLVLIDIDAGGLQGSAYVFSYTPSALAGLARLIADIGAEIVGMPAMPLDIARYFDRRFRLLGLQGLVGMALSGIDMALWDHFARAAGTTVAEALGAAPRPIQAYDSYGVIDIRNDEKALRDSVDAGFRTIKIKIGDGDLGRDVETVGAVRQIVGPGIALMVDFNQSLSVAEARRRIAALAPFDLFWVEEPVRAEDLSGHAMLRQTAGVPIQTGENWWFPAGAQAGMMAGASDHAMFDIMKIGGITGWMAGAALAAQHGMPVSSHIFQEASAHALAATPTALLIEHLDLAGDILIDPATPRNGEITATGPGLGLVWNEAAVSRLMQN